MGDEHRDTHVWHINGQPITRDEYAARYLGLNHPDRDGFTADDHRYTCSSDQYTDTHVYAHGDAGDRAGE
jgi:hypothetical protein